MDGIANVAKQQQTQVSPSETQGRVAEQAQQVAQVQKMSTQDVAKDMTQEVKNNDTNITSEQDVQDLVKKLNQALLPMNTDLKFGVDSQDVFYVSVVESQTNKVIRRFPAEQAQEFLPKMQAVTGILFDNRG